jgi:hypothetical protein
LADYGFIAWRVSMVFEWLCPRLAEWLRQLAGRFVSIRNGPLRRCFATQMVNCSHLVG